MHVIVSTVFYHNCLVTRNSVGVCLFLLHFMINISLYDIYEMLKTEHTLQFRYFSTDWCKALLLYHLIRDINTRTRQIQMSFQAGSKALWRCSRTCVHTQAVPLISPQFAIFSTSTKASLLQPAGPSLQVCVSVLRAYRHLARLTLTEARVWTR